MRHHFYNKQTLIGTIVYAFYLESGLENTVGHAVSVSMAITVARVVVFIRKEHHVDLNTKS